MVVTATVAGGDGDDDDDDDDDVDVDREAADAALIAALAAEEDDTDAAIPMTQEDIKIGLLASEKVCLLASLPDVRADSLLRLCAFLRRSGIVLKYARSSRSSRVMLSLTPRPLYAQSERAGTLLRRSSNARSICAKSSLTFARTRASTRRRTAGCVFDASF